jgi:hypothetical protein
MKRLEPFIGEWNIESSLGPGIVGSCVFEWILGERFVAQRMERSRTLTRRTDS